jgi:hypothetical protein
MQTHADQQKKIRKDRLREAQQAWLDEIERTLEVTPSEIARLSDISPATLTRMRYKAGYNGTLSAAIVDRIEAATGIAAPAEVRPKKWQRPEGAGAKPSAAPVATGFSDQEAEPYVAPKGDPMANLVTAAVAGRVHVVPWTLRSRALEDELCQPGDIMIVDLNAQPQAGDIVCAQLYDFDRGSATRTVFRLFHPPFLVGAGREDGARTPHLIDANVGIKGVVELVIRRTRR